MKDLVYQTLEGDRILAIDPISRGVGFVVLEEDQLQLVDWGIRVCTRRNGRNGPPCPRVLRHLIARYEPSVVVIEGNESVTSLRYEALGAFVTAVTDVLDTSGLPIRTYSRDGIRQVFSRFGAITKEEIARTLVARFPELAPDQPPRRKMWESEDPRMSIFDALSLAVTFLGEKGSRSALGGPRGPIAA